MAPPPQKFRLARVDYTVEIISGEMDILNEQINRKKTELGDLNNLVRNANIELTSLQSQLLTLYIQQTGAFPRSI